MPYRLKPLRHTQVHIPKSGRLYSSMVEVGPAEVGLAEIGIAEVGPTKVGPTKIGAAEVS